MRARLSLASCALCVLGACGDSGSDAARDSGMDASDDGAGATGGAPVVWMPRDTGPPPSLDAGPQDDRECTLLLDVLAGAPTPRCAADTLPCLQACTGAEQGCDDACYAADPTPPVDGIDCNGCATGFLFSCLIDANCAAEVNAFLCCFEDQCLGGPDTCAEQMCIAQLQGIYNCAVSNSVGCLDPGIAAVACFASDEDAGT